VKGDTLGRSELFDEADLDAALARFDELSRPAQRLENAASRVYDRLWTYFAARDWAAIADITARDISDKDCRRVVNAGVRDGQDALIANLRAIAEVGAECVTSSVVATRGERLVLNRVRFSARRGEVSAEVLNIAEIDANDRIAASLQFDADDIDAAFAELDARYLAGEAAEHSHTWSLIARASAVFNRHVMPPTTPDWVNIDHRKVTAFAPGEMTPYMRATFDVAPDIKFYIEAVHRLTDLGAVFTQPGRGISHEGFEGEWRDIILMSIEGDQFNRCELFDEADLDAALARFDELSRSAPRLENAASQVAEQFVACFATRDWAAMSETLAEDMCNDDRRRLVGAGVLHGRDIDIAHMRAAADVGAKTITSTVIAIRGERLELSRSRLSGEDQGAEAFHTELLGIAEIDADERIVARVGFDPDDLDAAIAELDARYVVGEAAAYAHTWSVIVRGLAAFNRRELPGFTPDSVNIDHRRARGFAPGDLTAYIGATWDLAPDVSAYAEAVHRLSNLGAVWTHAVSGTSQDGFDAEWREICLATVEGDLINRIEMFEAEDLDAALARFDELSRPAP
jgi:hypothetical protein